MEASFTSQHHADYSGHLLHELYQQQQEARLTDFTLSSQGQDLRCHRAVLAASCPYFSAMFSAGLKEVEEGRAVMDAVDFDMLKAMVQFMYGEKVVIAWENVELLLEAVELFQIAELKKQVDGYIGDNVQADNSIYWWKMAEKFNLEVTADKAKHVMFTDLESVSKSDCFKELTRAEIIDYMQNEELKISHQDQVLNACIDWVLANINERKQLMLDVLKLVKLEKCSSATLYELTKKHSELFTETEVKIAIYHDLLPRLKTAELHERKSIVIIGGMAEYDKIRLDGCWLMNLESLNQKWEKICNIPSNTLGKQVSSVCIPRGFAVLCGGDSGTVNSRFDMKTRTWSDLPPTPEKLTDTVALYLDDNIYVLDGGLYANRVYTDKMYILNLNTLKWNLGPKLLEKQYRPIAAAHNNCLWVVYNDHTSAKSPCTLQMLASVARKWMYKSSFIPTSCSSQGGCLVGHNDNLYLVGSKEINFRNYSEVLNICHQYNIPTDQWTVMASNKSVPHLYGAAFAYGRKIVLCGGGDAYRGKFTDQIDEYDVDTNTWSECSIKLPKPITFFTAALL